MSLFEIQIKDVVKNLTAQTILSSSYASLKQAIIDLKPLPAIINSIDTHLAEQAHAEKEAYKQTETARACQKQCSDDIAEQQRDIQDASHDAARKTMFVNQLPQIQSLVEGHKHSLVSQETNYEILKNKLSMLNSSNTAIVNELAEINRRRTLIKLSYQQPVVTQHVHGHRHTHVHVHHPITQINYPINFNEELTNLAIRESQLQYDKRNLDVQIQSQTIENNTAYSSLSTTRKLKNEKEAEITQIQRQLRDIDSNDTNRLKRSSERDVRQQARNAQDPLLLQLSNRSREDLETNIRRYGNTIDNKRRELLNAAQDSSYTIFFEQMELYTSQDNQQLRVHYSEKIALSWILFYTKEYLIMKEEESRLNSDLTRLQSTLKTQQNKLSEAERTSQHNLQSNPRLQVENQRLLATNQSLENTAKSNSRWANRYFFKSIFSGFITLMTAELFLDPILFLIPGALAVFAIGSLIAAIVYKFQEHYNYNDIESNENKISANDCQKARQAKEMEALNAQTIPQLKIDIQFTEAKISQKQSELSAHQSSMALKRNQIGQVQPMAPQNQNGFFAANEQVYQYPATQVVMHPNLWVSNTI